MASGTCLREPEDLVQYAMPRANRIVSGKAGTFRLRRFGADRAPSRLGTCPHRNADDCRNDDSMEQPLALAFGTLVTNMATATGRRTKEGVRSIDASSLCWQQHVPVELVFWPIVFHRRGFVDGKEARRSQKTDREKATMITQWAHYGIWQSEMEVTFELCAISTIPDEPGVASSSDRPHAKSSMNDRWVTTAGRCSMTREEVVFATSLIGFLPCTTIPQNNPSMSNFNRLVQDL
ncbi:hypothetical protein ZHAS_00021813 [Anopheles sinensis]|uniref:Uncharacterized protein n=1 Tax=Anopheles sinensis TaxID=74873 RepID=A0A084WTN4_ANOSI|nr:hypothetical protein ZHAS_00021813 [Anopheles sinensis]